MELFPFSPLCKNSFLLSSFYFKLFFLFFTQSKNKNTQHRKTQDTTNKMDAGGIILIILVIIVAIIAILAFLGWYARRP